MEESKETTLTLRVESPALVIKDASRAARQLKAVVAQAKLAVRIGDREHLRFEAWQTLGVFFGIIPRVEEVTELRDNQGKFLGFNARAIAARDGVVLSQAEHECTREEENWAEKPRYQLKAMAETRACSRALKMVLSWVVVLAGYHPVPVEEVGEGPLPQNKML